MIHVNKCQCPSSEDFFYWPPEEITQYNNWCEVSNAHHKRRLKKVSRKNTQDLKTINLLSNK